MKWRYLIWPWRQKWRSFQDFVINRLHFFFRILFFVKNPYIQRLTLFIMSLLEEFIVIWRLNVSIEKKMYIFLCRTSFFVLNKEHVRSFTYVWMKIFHKILIWRGEYFREGKLKNSSSKLRKKILSITNFFDILYSWIL